MLLESPLRQYLVLNLERWVDPSFRRVAMEERLAVRRTSLQTEFIAADLAIAQLNSQLDSLGALGNQFRLF